MAGFTLTQLVNTVQQLPTLSVVGGLQSLTDLFSSTPQNYFTVPIPNNTLALYTLTLKGQDTATSPIQTIEQYTFPLSPSSISKRYINMSVNYDVRGDSAHNGVQRIVDNYGVGPPLITISGTTGFQYHSLDGFKWTGKDSIAILLRILTEYAEISTLAADNNFPPPVLEFADSYVGEQYEVIPFREMGIGMDASRALYQYYTIQLLSTKILSAPQPQAPDPVTQAIVQIRGLLTEALVDTATNLINSLGEALGLPGA